MLGLLASILDPLEVDMDTCEVARGVSGGAESDRGFRGGGDNRPADSIGSRSLRGLW